MERNKRAPEIVINNTGAFDSLVSGLNNDALNGIEIVPYGTNGKITGQVLLRDVSSRDTSGNMRSGRRVFRRTEITTAKQVNQTRTGMRQRLVPQTETQ